MQKWPVLVQCSLPLADLYLLRDDIDAEVGSRRVAVYCSTSSTSSTSNNLRVHNVLDSIFGELHHPLDAMKLASDPCCSSAMLAVLSFWLKE